MDRTPRALFLVAVVAALVVASCAPKKVFLHDVPGIRGDVVGLAVGLIGKPYRLGGKGPDDFDCSGFVQFAYRRAGIALPPAAEGIRQEGRAVSRDLVMPGDLVFFNIKGGLHVGIMVAGSQFVHASKSRGVALDDADAPYWRRKLAGFRAGL
jgi:cell wall-associated NlpC family hydrolase